MIQRSATFKVICAATALGAFLITSATNEAKRIESIPFRSIDLADVPDGAHQGAIVFQNQLTKVTVTTVGHRIRDIQIDSHLSGHVYTNGAQQLVSEVVTTQTLNATNDASKPVLERASRKALLLAIQAALDHAPLPARNERSPSSPSSIFFQLAFFALCGSLGTQLAGYLAFRSGNLSAATKWVSLEDLTFYAGGLCCALGLLLIIGR